MNLHKLYKSNKLPRTKMVIEKISESAKSQWETMTAESNPLWWGKMALSMGPGGGGGILTKDIPGGKMVYYANKGKYNYMQILDKGRSRYDMKPALLASHRARQGENGVYLIIAFTQNKDGSRVNAKNNSIEKSIKKVGSFLGKNAKGQDVRRNIYKYKKMDSNNEGKDKAFVSEQKVKGGGTHRSYMKFVCLSEHSQGWFYPQIIPHRFIDKLKKDVSKAMDSNVMKKAIVEDYRDIINDLIKKNNSKKKL